MFTKDFDDVCTTEDAVFLRELRKLEKFELMHDDWLADRKGQYVFMVIAAFWGLFPKEMKEHCKELKRKRRQVGRNPP